MLGAPASENWRQFSPLTTFRLSPSFGTGAAGDAEGPQTPQHGPVHAVHLPAVSRQGGQVKAQSHIDSLTSHQASCLEMCGA